MTPLHGEEKFRADVRYAHEPLKAINPLHVNTGSSVTLDPVLTCDGFRLIEFWVATPLLAARNDVIYDMQIGLVNEVNVSPPA